MRRFAAVKARYDAATDKKSMPTGPLAELVKELDFGRAGNLSAKADRWLERREQQRG